jgi:hypothetical protein
MRIPDYEVTQFRGLVTAVKDTKTLKPGTAIENKNWATAKLGDHIELRRGSALLGATRQTGAGKITGLGVAVDYNGDEVAFFSHGRKVKYYDADADDTVEVLDRSGSGNLLSLASDGEDCWFAPNQNLGGSNMYVGAPHSTIWKIPVANKTHAVDQAVSSFRFGSLRFSQGRAFAGRRYGTTAGNQDLTGMYLSDIDQANLSSFTQVTGESFGTGNGATLTFTHTLATLASTPKTAMYVAVTDGTESFVDNRDGTLTGSAGGSGTVNYATGAVSVTFNAAPANLAAITCSYYVEDATSDGPLDFDTSSTGAGKAKIFRQDDGGPFMAALNFLDVNYCFHLLKTWALTTTIDDTAATNLPYRNIGIPHPRAVKETPDGILVIDTSNPNEPKVRRLQIGQNTNNLTIIPVSISDALDLSMYDFSEAVAFRWGDYEIVCCGEYTNGVANGFNSVMLVRNVISGAWDLLDYRATCLAILDGALIAGDSISSNVFTLFSGFDDDEGPIDNVIEFAPVNLGTEHLKRTHFMRVRGLIQKDQSIAVYIVLDDGSPVWVFTIEGDGAYVDQGISHTIGSSTLGSIVIGGGGEEETAHPYDVTFGIHTDIYQRIAARFQALGIGHAQIDAYLFKDNRDKGARSLPTKTA